MAIRNKPLTAPPVTSIAVGERKTFTTIWSNWFNTLYYQNSNANHEVVTGASTINPDSNYHSLTTTSGGGTYAITLDPPTIPGKVKSIEMIARGGSSNVTLSLTNCVGGSASTTCTWNSVGDALLLISLSGKWLILKEYGVSLT